MHKKSETFGKFKEFMAEAEKQLGKSLKTLRSDRGGEYLEYKVQGSFVGAWNPIPTHSTWNTTADWCCRKEKQNVTRYG